MATGRSMSALLGGSFLACLVLLAGCGSGSDDPTSRAGGSMPAADLAPSQVTGSTVTPPEPPVLCDQQHLTLVSTQPVGEGQPDQLIEVVNEGDRECDVDISASADAAEEMEPSVRLVPGHIGQIWVVGVDGCDETLADPPSELGLDVNGEVRLVDLEFVSPCGVEIVAFFTD